MNLLILNAGSSSLKCTLMDAEQDAVLARGMADWAGAETQYRYQGPEHNENTEHTGRGNHADPVQVDWKGHAAAVRRFISDLQHVEPLALPDPSSLVAVGHRIVHGGEFTSSVRITAEVRSRIAALAELAPLHNRPSLETLAAAEAELPRVPHIAVFDTTFHASLSPEAFTYPIPHQWTQRWGIRRYGFHGLSHAYCARRAAEMLNRPASDLRLVICHLGHGCSAAAVRGGRSVDTTMGFTPLEGLMMATRSGSIDPEIVAYMQHHQGLSAEQVEHALQRESGLWGVSGVSADMREVLAAAQSGHQQSRLAVAIYTRRIRQAVGAFAVTMGGIDALVFTAGVGEHAAEVRASVCDGLECLGLELDAQANATCQPDADIALPHSPGRILIISTREDLTILREVRDVLSTNPLTN
ncbi:acetate/propionate family kinase [Roseimaritima ulvae]|uniref:Acetate kinase n=1 Tax=Roseimaritima ulvae TaxID=980254 RepID=A0A5B9R8X3_9BACT|nr:acetate kinase [Roseimaritima ulvae]QEG43153.1 Acetate kinase [Roseimaritima ulvae]